MLQPVQPDLFFWCYLGFFSSLAWLFSSLMMDFLNKITGGPVANIFLRLTIIFSWFVVNFFVYKVFRFLLANPQVDSFFGGCERVGKTVGSALLFFGNVGLYYYSEKSIACMLTFLFLALYCLCALFCIQPYTDFGVLGFILSASLNRALCLFGLQHIISWLVLIVCVLIAGLHYRLEPLVQVVQPPPPLIILEEEMEEIQQVDQQLPILNHPSLEEEEPLIPLTSGPPPPLEIEIQQPPNLPSSPSPDEQLVIQQIEEPPPPIPKFLSLKKKLSNLLSLNKLSNSLKELNNFLSLIE